MRHNFIHNTTPPRLDTRETTTMEAKQESPRRKPGRPKRGNTFGKYTVMLPPDLHEWAMQQPEGLSALTRRLLQQERDRAQRR